MRRRDECRIIETSMARMRKYKPGMGVLKKKLYESKGYCRSNAWHFPLEQLHLPTAFIPPPFTIDVRWESKRRERSRFQTYCPLYIVHMYGSYVHSCSNAVRDKKKNGGTDRAFVLLSEDVLHMWADGGLYLTIVALWQLRVRFFISFFSNYWSLRHPARDLVTFWQRR